MVQPMVQRVRVVAERLRTNFFVLPAVAVVASYFAGRIVVGVEVGDWVGDATVDSARALMSTVAAATITFASIAFSVSLLIMQQGSTQFSPRVIHGITRDPFNRRVIAFVLATFTYCLVVLQRTRGPLESGGEEVVPRFAVALGLVLGVLAVLAVVAMIHHTARMMDVSMILDVIVRHSLDVDPASLSGLRPIEDTSTPADEGEGSSIRFDDDGWIGQLDRAGLLAAVAPGSTVRLHVDTGHYAIRSTRICTIWPAVPHAEIDRVEAAVRGAVQLGRTRTMVEDRAYGVRQLVDIALRALSPGVNDPTTARDAIGHLGTLLAAGFEVPEAPLAMADEQGRRLLTPHAADDAHMAHLACAEIRAAATGNVTVTVALVRMLAAVVEAACARGERARTEPFIAEARLLVAEQPVSTADAVRRAFDEAFFG